MPFCHVSRHIFLLDIVSLTGYEQLAPLVAYHLEAPYNASDEISQQNLTKYRVNILLLPMHLHAVI